MSGMGFEIAGRRIGPGEPPYVVAEMSANHRGDFDRAVRIVEAAAAAGADAVKLQTYTPDTLTIDSDRPWFRVQGTPWAGRRLYELYAEAATPWEWHEPLARRAGELGISLFSTAFDATAVQFLERLDAPAYKIASFELVDLPLLRSAAATGKPVILSTGAAGLAEIEEAVRAVRQCGPGDLTLLKCTSAYPATAEQMNLRTIPHLADAFGVPVGLSDHTLDLAVPVAAVTLGACLVEKHLTLSRAEGGCDAAFSLEPAELAATVQAVRAARQALGGVRYGAAAGEEIARRLRRSLFVVRDIQAGEPFTAENVRIIRPGGGLHPRYLELVLGRTARSDIPRGTPLDWSHVGS